MYLTTIDNPLYLKKIVDYLLKGENPPITLYKNNVACIAPLKGEYIKGDRTKKFYQNFSSLMIYKRMVKLMYNRSN